MKLIENARAKLAKLAEEDWGQVGVSRW